MFRGYIQKLEEKENAVHKNNIEINRKAYGYFNSLPKLGDRFSVGSFSTSIVTEIINYDEFLTLNSKYKIHFEKVEGLLVHKELKNAIYVRGLYRFPNEERKYLTIDKKTFLMADKAQQPVYQDLLITIEEIFKDYLPSIQIFGSPSYWDEIIKEPSEIENFTSYRFNGDFIFKLNEEEGIIFYSDKIDTIGDRVFYELKNDL